MPMLVYKITETTGEVEYYCARKEEEARAAHDADWEDKAQTVVPLTEDEMERFTVAMTDENEEETGEFMTFKDYLAELGAEDREAFQFCGAI